MMIQEVNISFSILKVSSRTTTMLAIEVKFSLMLLVGLDLSPDFHSMFLMKQRVSIQTIVL